MAPVTVAPATVTPTTTTPTSTVAAITPVANAYATSRNAVANANNAVGYGYSEGGFTTDRNHGDPVFASRFLRVHSFNHGYLPAGADHEMELSTILKYFTQYDEFLNCSLYYWNGVYLRFDATDDASQAKNILEWAGGIYSDLIDSFDFARAKSMDSMCIDEFEGQIKLVMHCSTASGMPFCLADVRDLNERVGLLLGLFGDIGHFVHIATDDNAMTFTYRVEFKSVLVAHRAVVSLSKDTATGTFPNGVWRWTVVEATHWAALTSPHPARPRMDPKSRLTVFRGSQAHIAKGSNPYESHNRVRLERIQDGTDVRTTIMLRNIPNKLDWMSLVAKLNDVCFGTFDFVYLRIDFKSCNNVGYAFVNFSDISGMVAMLTKIDGHGWPGFKSTKCAEISYATIQGKDALVQKFRNSSVMQEAPFCRPHLFMTYDTARANRAIRETGTEEMFPVSDNPSKMSRSIDNARALGLFPPTGINANATHRSLISDYDRGNPRDLDHVAAMRQQYGPAPTYGVTVQQRQACEDWYSARYGMSQHGRVPFSHIPVGIVQEFLQSGPGYGPSPAQANNPGVIARPILPGFGSMYDVHHHDGHAGPSHAGPSHAGRSRAGRGRAGPGRSPHGY
ncbi:hypothetical protein P280DRAFT_404151 [Massarina eburnea CBS 473.64]|uniref:Mei2-like C-terminal RNA recognition motif domain-containing protein n=1 Tax=Massarina eburnea CBS 473.64 TaxID=1395130 RepID=A0A6A6RWX2_9PLEO|nr:hypothetical protein P280DRAFT_404151 [Massarina eburnea CBS 473.64]